MTIVKSAFHVCCFVFLAYLVKHQVKGIIWENMMSPGVGEQELQRIPPLEETAEKLMTYFLARGPGKLRRVKRQAPPWNRWFVYDVVFIIDASSSIDPKEFERAKRGLIHLISRAKRSTHYAAVCYSNRAKIAFNFTRSAVAKKYISTKVQHEQGMTNTQAALKLCRTQLLMNPSSGVRKRSFKRVMVVTDGRSNLYKELTLFRALQLKFMGIEIYVLAVGKHIHGIQELASLATTPKSHLFRVQDFKSFVRVVRLIPRWKVLRRSYQKEKVERR